MISKQDPLALSEQLKRIASEKAISHFDIAKKTGLHVDIIEAALEGYPMTPISHFLRIAEVIGCKLELSTIESASETTS